MACTGIQSAPRMPICWSRETFFLSPSPSLPSAAPSTAKANMPIGWPESLTAREGRLTARKLSRSFDDKHGFVVDQGLIAILAEIVILLRRVGQQRVADFFSGTSVMFAHHRLELLAPLLVAAVVNSIGIEDKNISWAHEGDLGEIGSIEFSLAYIQGIVFLKIGVVCR